MKITNTYSNKNPVGSSRVLKTSGFVPWCVEMETSYFELATIWTESDALLWTGGPMSCSFMRYFLAAFTISTESLAAASLESR